MNLTEEHIAQKKKVGKIGEAPIFEVVTTGGLNLIISTKGGRFETLGAGPHRAVARHIAMKREPSISWTDLQKADHVTDDVIGPLLKEYVAETMRWRRAGGFED